MIGSSAGERLTGLPWVCDPLANLISGFMIATFAHRYGLRYDPDLAKNVYDSYRISTIGNMTDPIGFTIVLMGYTM